MMPRLELDRWLLEEVAPAYDAMKANPDSGTPIKDVMKGIRANHAARLKGKK